MRERLLARPSRTAARLASENRKGSVRCDRKEPLSLSELAPPDRTGERWMLCYIATRSPGTPNSPTQINDARESRSDSTRCEVCVISLLQLDEWGGTIP